MATTPASRLVDSEEKGRKVGVVRFAASGGVSAALVFVVCWLGTMIPFSSPTHAYIQLFTLAQMSSIDALLEGSLWSLLFGALVGLVFASVYNALSGFERR